MQVRVWSLASSAAAGCLRAHRAPVMQLVWAGDLLASADREGSVLAWDVETGVATALGQHRGHATALTAVFGGSHLASGGQDGRVCLYDCRLAGCGAAVASVAVHTGAVNDLVSHTLPSGTEVMLFSSLVLTPILP